MVFRLLVEELEKDGVAVSGIMERNDVAIRKLEGLEQYKGWYKAERLFCRWKQLPLQKIPTYVRYRRQTAIYHKPYIYNALNGVRHAYF